MNKKVLPIKYNETKDWLLKKHYAHRMPSISYSFGLYVDNQLEGIVCFGSPPSQSLCKGICGEDYKSDVLELNRLAINSTAPKNSASFLVANAFKLLPKKKWIIVSYADTSQKHIGYIYQATNFIYTGLSDKRTEWRMKGTNKHSKTICEQYSLEERKNSDKFMVVQRPRKHRYILFLGDKSEKKELKSNLKYPIKDYPKGKSEKYDCIDIKKSQGTLSDYTVTETSSQCSKTEKNK